MRARWLAGSAAVAAFVGSAAIGLALIRPWIAGPVGFDSAAAVIHFDRIVAGQILEAFVTTTPKPFLTAAYGLLFAISHDWRLISLADIGAYAACSAAAWLLFGRVAGPAAAAFAAAATVGSATLLSELAMAYAVPWALLFWLLAGLGATATRPRFGLAGICLMLAVLARLESLVLVGTIAAVLLGATLAGRVGGSPIHAPGRRAWLLLLGFLALPIMLLHDWRLTGDPFFWTEVSARFSAAAASSVQTPPELLLAIGRHFRTEAVLVLIAAVGVIGVLRARAWVVGLGLLGLGPGVGLFLLFLSARGIYVSDRYYAAMDLALIGAAAMAFALLPVGRLRGARQSPESAASDAVGGGPRGQPPTPAGLATLAVAASIAFGGLVGVVAVWRGGLLSASIRADIAAQREEAQHADEALPALAAELDRIPGSRASPAGLDWRTSRSELTIIRVPALERPRLAVDLGVPVSRIGGTGASMLVPNEAFLEPSRLVFHDRLGDRPAAAYASLEVTKPTTIGGHLVTPLAAKQAEGWWVLRIDPPGS